MADRILVVDDEESMRDVLKKMLSAEGYKVSLAENGKKALALLEKERFDHILCDIRMPGMGGLELLREITGRKIPGTAIMMSAFGTVETAVEAMKLGAYDYISKPFMSDEILLTLKKAHERESLRKENEILRQEVEKAFRPEDFIYASRAMEDVVRMVEKVKDYETTALVTGESGTGKEIVARMLHYGGRRKAKPFVAINCGAIPETLLESELFGHRKGAFTEAKSDRAGLIEEANGGTLFLDEIGELPLMLQTKLLRFLQEGELRRLGDTEVRKLNVRIVAATARDLEQEVSAGTFRQDLYYRLNVIRIHVPPLRERKVDIPLLAQHFLARFCRKFRKALRSPRGGRGDLPGAAGIDLGRGSCRGERGGKVPADGDPCPRISFGSGLEERRKGGGAADDPAGPGADGRKSPESRGIAGDLMVI
jgi:two-component system response regulator AtoC